MFLFQSLVGIVYSWDYDGIWSSSIPQLSFLINENIFVECFRFCLSFIGHRISPLAMKYKPPHLFLFHVYPSFSASPAKFLRLPWSICLVYYRPFWTVEYITRCTVKKHTEFDPCILPQQTPCLIPRPD